MFFKKEPKPLPLPIGRKEFEVWSERIIKGANIPGLTKDSALFSLTSMLLHLPSTQSFHTDAFFVHGLRKAAINETAVDVMKELQKRLQERKDAEAAKLQVPAAPALKLVDLNPSDKN